MDKARRILLGTTALVAAGAAGAIIGSNSSSLAQVIPGMIKLTSYSSPFGIGTIGPGPQSSYLYVSGGTFTCAGGATAVANTNVDAGSAVIMTLKTPGGTAAAPYLTGITAGTGFTVTCGTSDTSTYNYVVLG
jgi:hypothetical protein